MTAEPGKSAEDGAPVDACDCHTHVIGDPLRYPFVAARAFTPLPATLGDWRNAHAPMAVFRGVLVQVSVHGTDNRAMLEALRRGGNQLRGVAVVEPDISDARLAELHAGNVRAIRLNDVVPGGIGTRHLERLAGAIAKAGWHVELLLDPANIASVARRLGRLNVAHVFDHMGYVPFVRGVASPAFRNLLAALRDGGAWVKLSGFRRLSSSPDYSDGLPLARALYEAAPDRVVWGSDWPHVALPPSPHGDSDLLAALFRWFPDEADRRQILVDNPARLYGFGATEQDGAKPAEREAVC